VSSSPHWPAYYGAVAKAGPRATLLAALAGFGDQEGASQRLAVDLGCGGGTDTVELLRRGWRVLAIDAEPRGIEVLLQRDDLVASESLETRVARLEETTWPPADLVNASLVLPFLAPDAFERVWQRITMSLGPGSRFAGHFFGQRDDWAHLAGRSHHSPAQLEALLAAFDLERFEEREWDGETALGEAKHWHIFEVVARRR
jgi:SAM-dependent methyltransferase